MLRQKARILRFVIIIFSSMFLQYLLSAEQAQKVDTESIFEKANKLYKDGNYESAMNFYQQISDKSAAVNYNLGNCAYKLNKFGLAHLYWRRAEKDWGFWGRAELTNNIKLVKEKIREQKNTNSEKKTDAVLKNIKNLRLKISSFIRATPLTVFQFVFLFFWVFLFMSIRNLLRYKRKILVFMLFTFIAISGLLLVGKYSFEYKQLGIVTIDNAKILSGPGDNYQVLGFAPEAKEVIIQKISNGYFKVKVSGQIGWISQMEVEKI